MKQVTLTTDGACLGNPGPGGWAFILEYQTYRKEQSGACAETTTNNRMELQAAIEGFRTLKEPCKVLLVSDSQYLIKGLKWMRGWKAKGWSLSRKKFRPVANAELWKTLDELAAQHHITGQWVRGHNGHADNERCNELAEAQAQGRACPALDTFTAQSPVTAAEMHHRRMLANWFAGLPDE